MLPDFITETEDLDTHAKCDVVFDSFTLQVGREDLFKAAEAYMRKRIPGSSPYTFKDLPSGIMGYIISLTLQAAMKMHQINLSVSLATRLMLFYKFDGDSIPPRLLAREAIALQVQLDKVSSDLNRMMDSSFDFTNVVKLAAANLSDPADAYDLRDEVIDKILE